MAILSVSNLGFSYGDHVILDGVNLTIDRGEHVGLVGLNGCGKSTLMKLIAGLGDAAQMTGQLQLARGTKVGYLSQHHELNLENTLREEAGSAYAELFKLHKKIDKLNHDMAEAEGKKLEDILTKYEKLQEKMEAMGGYAVDHKVDATLHGLGVLDESFGVKVKDLSGGQRGRLALAKMLLAEPDLLLLDEPTNHLDIEGRRWLEEFLSSYSGGVIVISHDRWLLDRSVSKIYELDRGRMEEYPGNYMKYRVLRQERLELRLSEYQKFKLTVKREQAYIDRYRAGQRSKQAQGREKRLIRFKRDEVVEMPPSFSTMSLKLGTTTRSGDIVITATQISKTYDQRHLFGPIDIYIRRGDRIGVIGPNGAGKTTVVNCLLGELEPDTGEVRTGSQVGVGYYRQTHEHLDLDLTVTHYLRKFTDSEQEARDLAGAFLFSGASQDKELGVLSGGERGRAVLAGLVAGGHNLLVLDEPTNHLDIPSAERLEDAVIEYTKPPKGYGTKTSGGGTLILITHDRMLLDNIVNQLLIFDGEGGLTHFLGNYTEYLESIKPKVLSDNAPAPKTNKSTPKKQPAKQAPKPQAQSQKSNPPRKKSKGAVGLLSQGKLESQIADTESKLEEIDFELANPDVWRDGDKVKTLQQKREQLAEKLAPLEEEWLSRS